MARLETWYKQDLKKPLIVHKHADVFNQDSRGNLIGVEVYSNGEPVTLAGSISGYCLLADGTTVPAVGASRSGNKASVLIPQTAYSVPGPITITIKNVEGNDIATLCAVVGLVRQSVSGNLVNPGSVVTDWSNSINAQLQAVQTAADNVGAIVAAPFDENTVYVAGNYVTNNGNLYRITAGHAAGVAWADTTKVQCTVGNELSELKSALDAFLVEMDMGTIAENKYITNLGALGNSNGWSATHDYLSCDGYNTILIKTEYAEPSAWNAWYDASNGFIERFTLSYGDNYLSVPEGAKSFRISAKSADFATAECYGIESTIEKIKDLQERVAEFNTIKTYIPLGSIVNDKYITATGGIGNSTGWSATLDYVPCSGILQIDNEYSSASGWNCWYDKDYNLIGTRFEIAKGHNTITVPTDAKYMRLSALTANLATLQIYTTQNTVDVISELSQSADNKYIKFLSWNVGVFNLGGGRVSPADAPAQMQKIRKIIGNIDAELANFQEFVAYIDNANTYDSKQVINFKYPFINGVSRTCASKIGQNNFTIHTFASGSGRGYSTYDVSIYGKTITIINAHLSIEVDPSTYRDADIQELVTFMATKDYVILSGDFNVYTDAEFEPFRTAGYKLCNGGDFGWFKTWPVNIEGSLWGTEHLDNIIVSSNITPQFVETYECPVSDHAPLIAYLRID